MKTADFSEDRAKANEKHRVAMDLVKDVKNYFEDVENIKANVTVEDERIKKLDQNLDDLKQYTENASEKLKAAKMLNFQNSNPAVRFKESKIRQQMEASEANNQLGKQLIGEAREFLNEADRAYDRFLF